MPNTSEVLTSTTLSNVAMEYDLTNQGFGAPALLPPLPVATSTGTFYKVDTERITLASENNTLRAPGQVAKEVDWHTSTDTYATKNYSLKEYTPDEIRNDANASQSPVSGLLASPMRIKHRLMVEAEIAAAAALVAGVTTNTGTGAANAHWDAGSEDVISWFLAAHLAIENACGNHANVLVADSNAIRRLMNHTQIIARIVGGATPGQPGVVSLANLAAVLMVDRIVPSFALQNAAVQGQTASLSRIWGENAFLAYVNTSNDVRDISLGRTFVWNQPGSADGWLAQTWRDDERKSDVVQLDYSYVYKITDETAAYKFTDILT